MKVSVLNISNRDVTLHFRGSVLQLAVGESIHEVSEAANKTLKRLSYLVVTDLVEEPSQADVSLETIPEVDAEPSAEALGNVEEVAAVQTVDASETAPDAEVEQPSVDLSHLPVESDPVIEDSPVDPVVDLGSMRTADLRDLYKSLGLDPKGVKRADLISAIESK